MNGLTVYQQGGLPAQPDDLAKFIVISQERLKAVKAEIRAIQRLDMAKEVYDQKIEEQARLQELTLLAYQRMGEITRKIPTSAGGRPSKSAPSTGNVRKTKKQVIQDLGLSTSQVGRMELMAVHPEIVEEVIAESQAGQTDATQAEVLRRIKSLDELRVPFWRAVREERENNPDLKLFRKATRYCDLPKITDAVLDAVVDHSCVLCNDISRLEDSIRLLSKIRDKLRDKVSKKHSESIETEEDFDGLPPWFATDVDYDLESIL